jgi:hypothetical protein
MPERLFDLPSAFTSLLCENHSKTREQEHLGIEKTVQVADHFSFKFCRKRPLLLEFESKKIGDDTSGKRTERRAISRQDGNLSRVWTEISGLHGKESVIK